MKVKICGISDLKHAQVAAEAGADFIGFVFAESKRRVTPEAAGEIIQALKQDDVNRRAKFVGVFVNETPAIINTIAAKCGLDFVQLSGDESPEYCKMISLPTIKSIRPKTREQAFSALEYEAVCDCVLFDSFQPGLFGGSGITGDWTLAAEVAKKMRLILAGGLTPENVISAAKIVSPWGVDVSSGVETAGKKDETKIVDFVTAVRSEHGH